MLWAGIASARDFLVNWASVGCMLRIVNNVRPYAWGSPTAIPELLRVPSTGEPMAEMWLGAHPGASSMVDGVTPLSDVIAADPVEALGQPSIDEFGAELPYLMKVLAAAEPLSLQVHPTMTQARAGFAAEEAAGVPIDAPFRNYKDPRHKPEMIVALSPFDALSGFRAPARARAGFVSILGEPEANQGFWATLNTALAGTHSAEALADALTLLLTGGDEARHFVEMLVEAAHDASGEDADTARLLGAFYPGDPGVAAALLLNRVHLVPGEALYLDAGLVHAYISGLGIEVMAASDNVLRGGLTPKHIDVPELEKIVSFVVSNPLLVEPVESARWGVKSLTYQPPVAEFQVERLDMEPGASVVVTGFGARIALVIQGSVDVGGVVISRGESGFIPASEGDVTLVAGAEGASVFVTAPSARPRT